METRCISTPKKESPRRRPGGVPLQHPFMLINIMILIISMIPLLFLLLLLLRRSSIILVIIIIVIIILILLLLLIIIIIIAAQEACPSSILTLNRADFKAEEVTVVVKETARY